MLDHEPDIVRIPDLLASRILQTCSHNAGDKNDGNDLAFYDDLIENVSLQPLDGLEELRPFHFDGIDHVRHASASGRLRTGFRANSSSAPFRETRRCRPVRSRTQVFGPEVKRRGKPYAPGPIWAGALAGTPRSKSSRLRGGPFVFRGYTLCS